MRLIIFSVLLTIAACMPRDRGQSESQDHDHDHDSAIPMSKVYGKARKVPGRESSSFGGSGATCPIDCMKRMKSDIENDAEFGEFIDKQSKPYRFDNQFDTRMLNKYCQKMNRTVDCVRPCSEGQMKNMATKALSLPKYMCVETKFVEYAPCYNRVGKQMEKVCHAQNKCGPKKTALENDMRLQPRDMADIEKMLKHTCDYMSCYMECDRPKVVQECGADANRVLEGLYRKSIDVMKDIFSTMGISVRIPTECNRVGSGSSIDTDDDEDDDHHSRSSNRGGSDHQTGGSRGSHTGGQGRGRSGSTREGVRTQVQERVGSRGNQGTGTRGQQTTNTRRGSDHDQDDNDDDTDE